MSEDAPHYGPMNEQRAREILRDRIDAASQGLSADMPLVYWRPQEGAVNLDGEFTADELEAVAWWMRNKTGDSPQPAQHDAGAMLLSAQIALIKLEGMPATPAQREIIAAVLDYICPQRDKA